MIARNRAVRLKIEGTATQDAVAKVPAGAGKKLLVLTTEWENIIPLVFVENTGLATQYQVPDLSDHLYLVVNGRQVSRVHPKASSMPGHVPVKNFRIDPLGGGRILADILRERVARGGFTGTGAAGQDGSAEQKRQRQTTTHVHGTSI